MYSTLTFNPFRVANQEYLKAQVRITKKFPAK